MEVKLRNRMKRRFNMKLSRCFLFSLIAMIVMGIGLIYPAFAQEKVVREALKASDIRSLDPHYGTTTIDYACIDPMFNALVRFRPADINPEKIEPDLAERWERSRRTRPQATISTVGRQGAPLALRTRSASHSQIPRPLSATLSAIRPLLFHFYRPAEATFLL
jgi:hypothetical protein